MTKKLILTIACLVFLLMSLTICWAEDPSGLVIVRASDGSLWKATCLSGTCTAFTNFPGNFGSQPTVYWDEKWERYVIWGRASDSSIWRATFSSAGTFQNDWTSIAGATASPIGASGGYFPAGSDSTAKGSISVASISTDCGAKTNLATIAMTPKRSGDMTVFASGIYHMDTGGQWVSVCLDDASGGSTCDSWSPYLQPSSTTEFINEYRYALNQRYGVTAGTTKTVYLKACREGSATGTLYWNELTMINTNREY
jgi:hypothetical protein